MADECAMTPDAQSDPNAPPAAFEVVRPSAVALLDDLLAFCETRQRVTIGEVVDRLGAAGFPVLVLALVLPALIPIPGPYGMVFGAALAILALQMIVARPKPWLPALLTNRSISAELLVKGGGRVRSWLVWVEGLHSPGRLRRFAGQRMSRISGLAILPLSIMIGLPIPFGNVPPVLAIGMIAFALILRDGLALAIGFVAAVLATGWVVALFWFGGELLERFWLLIA